MQTQRKAVEAGQCPLCSGIGHLCDFVFESPKPSIWGPSRYILKDLALLFFFSKFIYLLILDCAGSSLLHRLPSVVGSGGSSLVVVLGLLSAVASLLAKHGL